MTDGPLSAWKEIEPGRDLLLLSLWLDGCGYIIKTTFGEVKLALIFDIESSAPAGAFEPVSCPNPLVPPNSISPNPPEAAFGVWRRGLLRRV